MATKNLHYQDAVINIKQLLPAMWTSVMFLYIYGDYFELYVPQKVAGLLNGQHLLNTPNKLFCAAIILAIPSIMIFLSLILKPRRSRMLNIAVGTFFTLFTLIVGFLSFTEWRMFYVTLSFTESILTAMIVWKAWHWPQQS